MANEHKTQCRGRAFVVLALDLGIFLNRDDREKLHNWRGHKMFDHFLEKFDPSDPRFVRDDDYKRIEHRGYELGVFHRILAEDNFAPTYRLIKKEVKFPAQLVNNVQFKEKFLRVWKKWDIWFRLSSNGIITIILKIQYPKLHRLIDVSRDVMGLQGHFDMASAKAKIVELESIDTPASRSHIASVQ
ncbi:hypothetical protein KFU94_31135 [Chloroflexi bacterium TSY]|nr:hypothetical protein [Chloroflexi bacterium TSY]